jgi:hypothetical protein
MRRLLRFSLINHGARCQHAAVRCDESSTHGQVRYATRWRACRISFASFGRWPIGQFKRSGRQLNHDRIATGLDSRPGLSHEGLGQQAPPRSLPYDLGADTSIEFKRDGMLFSMNMPVRPEKPADPVK